MAHVGPAQTRVAAPEVRAVLHRETRETWGHTYRRLCCTFSPREHRFWGMTESLP